MACVLSSVTCLSFVFAADAVKIVVATWIIICRWTLTILAINRKHQKGFFSIFLNLWNNPVTDDFLNVCRVYEIPQWKDSSTNCHLSVSVAFDGISQWSDRTPCLVTLRSAALPQPGQEMVISKLEQKNESTLWDLVIWSLQI